MNWHAGSMRSICNAEPCWCQQRQRCCRSCVSRYANEPISALSECCKLANWTTALPLVCYRPLAASLLAFAIFQRERRRRALSVCLVSNQSPSYRGRIDLPKEWGGVNAIATRIHRDAVVDDWHAALTRDEGRPGCSSRTVSRSTPFPRTTT